MLIKTAESESFLIARFQTCNILKLWHRAFNQRRNKGASLYSLLSWYHDISSQALSRLKMRPRNAIPLPCIDQFQNHLKSCFNDSQDAPPGSFQYLIQSCLIDSQDPDPGSFQYLIQSCLIKPHVPEDAHPLEPKAIIKAINASFFILPSLLTSIILQALPGVLRTRLRMG